MFIIDLLIQDIDTFWRTWNSPVHRWAVRHLYIPIIKGTNSKLMATGVTFFISAFFHEYLVSVPLRTYKVRSLPLGP
jgi:diacylglycerol O-acyltransferase-1